jgi:hypothetical protein
MHQCADRAASHRPDVQARREDAARIARRVRHDRRDELQHAKRQQQRQRHPAIERLVHEPVAHAHDLRRRND